MQKDAKQLTVFNEHGHWAHGNRSLQQRRPGWVRRGWRKRMSLSMTTADWPTSKFTARIAAT